MSMFVLFTISSGKYKKEHTNIDSVDHINENLVPWHILSCNVLRTLAEYENVNF